MIIFVSPIVGSYLVLFVANGIWNGWRIAYDVNVAITSPASGDVDLPWLAWPLSLGGWLVVPVLAGAVAGYAVNASLERRRAKGEARASSLGRARYKDRGSRLPARFEKIPPLRDRAYTKYFEISNEFVDYFLALHDGDWKVTEQHFELEVADILNSDVVRPSDPQSVAMHIAVKTSATLLWRTRTPDFSEGSSEEHSKPIGHCPHCPRDDYSTPSGELS